MPNNTAADDEIKAQQRASRQMLRNSVTGGDDQANMPGAYRTSLRDSESVVSKDQDYIVNKYVLDNGGSDDNSVSSHGGRVSNPVNGDAMGGSKKRRESPPAARPGSVRVSMDGSVMSQSEAKAARASTNASRASRSRSRSFDSSEHDDLATRETRMVALRKVARQKIR